MSTIAIKKISITVLDTDAIVNAANDGLWAGGGVCGAIFKAAGYLSNWYASPSDLDGEHFSSVEQYIMFRKCMIFGDDKSAKAVLATEDTAKQ